MEARDMRMDAEFDQHLIEMKQHVLRLPHKTERQRCAMWIKKLCEPMISTDERDNRNSHAKLLLHMLKRGLLDGPFAVRPEEGRLKPLPSYMQSIFFSDPPPTDHIQFADDLGHENPRYADVPDWVQSEIDNPMSSFTTSSPQPKLRLSKTGDSAVTRPWEVQTNDTLKGPSTFRDEQSLIQMHEKELEMKTKVLQAQSHEEKLRLQHKRDVAVQKILDRKNSEIEEIKNHYRNKDNDYEESTNKAKRKVQALTKELELLRESKDRQVEEMKTLVEETTEAARAEYDAKLQEAETGFERDKYELQKTHTKNIQELLDDTNQKLLKMEEEYNAQTTATKLVISELEGRVSQLMQETESLSLSKQTLMSEKQRAEMLLENAEKCLNQTERKYTDLENEFKIHKEDHDLQIKSMMSKHDANAEFLRQENSLALSKSQETVRDLQDQIHELKHALQDSEKERTRDLRERESLHQQDMMSLQQLQEKQLHQLRSEWDQEKSHHAKELRTREDIIHDRDEQITRLKLHQKQSSEQAENAIEEYKKQMSEAQKKIYADMQLQLEKVEEELEVNKKHQDRMKEDFRSQMEEMKRRHQEELAEMKTKCEQDKAHITQQAIADRDQLTKTYERQLEDAERRLCDTLEERKGITEKKEQQHHDTVTTMEAQIRGLREELVSANALRRQQLVELGLLREEERQKASREHDAAVNRLEGEIDRQRLEMHRQHAAELDRQAQKTKGRLESLEKDYKQRLERAYDRITELQQKETGLREDLSRMQIESEQHLMEDAARRDEEAKRLRLQLESANIALLAELEGEKEKLHSIQRQSQKTEFDLKDKLTKVKMDYEERMKGLMPMSLKRDMEDTIGCLRSQVSSLQQRVSVLQDDLDDNDRFRSFPMRSPSTTISALQEV